MNNETVTSVLIRRGTSTDARQVIAGINIICSEGGAFYTTFFLPTPQWEAVLYQPSTVPDHLLAVVERDGQIIGAGRLFPGGKHTLMNHVAELGLFVLEPFRRQGIGSQLLNQLISWAGQGSIEKLTLSVFASNLPAIHFFEKHGFSRVGCLHNQIMLEDRYVDLILMERSLHRIANK